MKKENQLFQRLLNIVTGQPQAAKEEAPVEAVVEEGVDVVTAAVEAAQALAAVEGVETVVEAGVEAVSSVVTLAVDASAIQAELSSVLAQVEVVTSALTEMTAKYEEAQAALAAVAAEKDAIEVAAKAAQAAARLAQVEAAIGTEKAAAFMTATQGLDDTQFASVVSALAGSVEAEAKTELFVEQGVTAEVDAAVLEEKPTHFKQYLSKE